MMSVRMATLRDVPQILEIYRPYIEHTAISFEYVVPSLEEFTQRFSGITAEFPWLVWEEDGCILGYAYGSKAFDRAAYQWSAAASIYLRQEAWGKGIGKKLYAALEEFLRLQGYRKVYAVITTANEASVAFHKAVGYRQTGTMPDCGYKFGNWYGTIWMEKDLNIWENPPRTPISLWDVPQELWPFPLEINIDSRKI
ncbi:MAG: N-acetyltransferase [Oscillospiraceae bacterium]|nr:N-acetyltransferase [Oscillospiraceae bacterium]